MTVRTPSVGIVGGGIGGMAAALALHRAGLDVTVYEQADEMREAGAGLMLWPNGSRVVRELGLLDEVIARSGANTHFLVRATSGEVLMDIPLGRFDAPAMCIRRADLLAVLLAAFPAAQVRLSHCLAALEPVRDKVRLTFQNRAAADHDAVIGADGIRSRVRTALFGEIRPVYRGYTIWRGVAAYDGAAVPAGSNSETWGRGQRFGLLDTGGGRFTWYATANLPAGPADHPGGRKSELLGRFAGWHAPISAVIAATPEAAILKNGAYDLWPLRRWGRSRITLLGDAAHPCTPNLGQGGCMALEDALTLAKSFQRNSAVPEALREYESLRQGRTRQIQRRSRVLGALGQWEDDVLVAGRKWMTRMLPGRLLEWNLAGVYAYQT